MYHFVLGLTSKLVGTEVGIIEPITSFSPCFGAVFMPHKMNVYAELLIRNGGLCGFAFVFAQEKHSMCTEGRYPYTATEGNLQRVELPSGHSSEQSHRLHGRGRRQQRLTIWSLGLASVLTLAILLVRWFWWALAMESYWALVVADMGYGAHSFAVVETTPHGQVEGIHISDESRWQCGLR